MIEERWYVGQTRSGLGPWAEKNLAAQGIPSYAPRIFGPDGESGENLFPRYLFVRLPIHPRAFTAANNTRGMHKLLPLHSEDPLSLPRGYIEDLQARVGLLGRLDVVEEITYDYAREEKIEITCGPWSGKTGEYQYRKKNVAMIMMKIMGRPMVVPVPIQNTKALVSTVAAC